MNRSIEARSGRTGFWSGAAFGMLAGIGSLLTFQERLAGAMDRLLSDRNMMRLFGARGLRKAKTYDMQRLSGQLLSVYAQAIEAGREGRFVTLSPEKAEN